jgi:hypothetical protein
MLEPVLSNRKLHRFALFDAVAEIPDLGELWVKRRSKTHQGWRYFPRTMKTALPDADRLHYFFSLWLGQHLTLQRSERDHHSYNPAFTFRIWRLSHGAWDWLLWRRRHQSNSPDHYHSAVAKGYLKKLFNPAVGGA